MNSLIALSGSAVLIFVSTNIDALFSMLAFFADRTYSRSRVVLGQYIGAFALFCVSIAASLGSHLFPADKVGWLGLIPIAIGLRKILVFSSWKEAGRDVPQSGPDPGQSGGVMSVALVSLANGGDNVGAYTPQFALHSGLEIAIMGLVFALMTALWCLIASWLVDHPALRTPLRLYGERIVPGLLIAVGLLTLIQGGVFRP